MGKVIEGLRCIKDPKKFCEKVDYIIDKCKTKERCMKKLFHVIEKRCDKTKPLILTWSPIFVQVIFTIGKEIYPRVDNKTSSIIYNNILYEYLGDWTQLSNMSTKFNGKISAKSNVRHAITKSC